MEKSLACQILTYWNQHSICISEFLSDTIYTEGYIGLPTPEDNWEGYNQSSVMPHLEGIANKEFLLIHGNADDNVHYQNSMMLARALEQADILFTGLVS